MFKIQSRQLGGGAWNLSALPTSLVSAMGQARNTSSRIYVADVRIVQGEGATAGVQRLLDLRV